MTGTKEYLDWAIPAFRLVHSGVKAQTQIHTHMCYSEFTDIIRAIDDMDADVITFEASRSDLLILDSLKENHFKTEVGPGVYDIHSPRVPSVEEIKAALEKMLTRIAREALGKSGLWIKNPRRTGDRCQLETSCGGGKGTAEGKHKKCYKRKPVQIDFAPALLFLKNLFRIPTILYHISYI